MTLRHPLKYQPPLQFAGPLITYLEVVWNPYSENIRIIHDKFFLILKGGTIKIGKKSMPS